MLHKQKKLLDSEILWYNILFQKPAPQRTEIDPNRLTALYT